jgi:hypothetical protein
MFKLKKLRWEVYENREFWTHIQLVMVWSNNSSEPTAKWVLHFIWYTRLGTQCILKTVLAGELHTKLRKNSVTFSGNSNHTYTAAAESKFNLTNRKHE